MLLYMDGCQNDGPLLDPILIRHLIFRGTQKRDHNCDNHRSLKAEGLPGLRYFPNPASLNLTTWAGLGSRV